MREQFLSECRTRQAEPPTPKQTDRIVGSALAETVAARAADRIDAATRSRLLALVETGDEDPGEGGGLDEASGAYDQVAVIKTR